MLLEATLDLIIAIYTIISAMVFGTISLRHKTLRLWLPCIILFPFGSVFIYLHNFFETLRIMGDILYLLAIVCLIFAIFVDYYQIYFKSRRERNFMQKNGKIIFFIGPVTLIVIPVQIVMIILSIVSLGMLIHIYLIQRTPTRAIMVLTLICGFISLSCTTLYEFGVWGMWELSYGMNFVFLTFFLATAIVALLEQRIVNSEKKYRDAYDRAELYKDLFAHDINNILQSIRSASDLLSMMEASDKKARSLEIMKIIDEQITRGARLVSNIQKISKLEESGNFIENIEIRKILDDAISSVKTIFPDKNLDIKIEVSEEKMFAKANRFLSEVFENLLVNAIMYNDSTRIEILVKISRTPPNWIRMEFQDNGIGIRDDRKESIFFRGQEKSSISGGMGIGLSLVRTIIDGYKGKIWVEDRVKGDYSQGSNIIILIPEGGVRNS
ncbi:MAG: sensor histidine kinase [Candidatus Helarchaeota archaeon]